MKPLAIPVILVIGAVCGSLLTIMAQQSDERSAFMEDCLNHFVPEYKCVSMWKGK